MDVVTLEQLLTKDIKGKVVCFPTDTVSGVGALIDDNDAIRKIYYLKNRDITKPLAVLTGTKDISKYVLEVSDFSKQLMAWILRSIKASKASESGTHIGKVSTFVSIKSPAQM